MPSRVQRILDEHDSLVFPGVFDTLSAKIAERVGFPLAFISGYAVSATLIGEPDLGLLTQTEVIDRARRICRTVAIPIIVDADTGYGDVLNVVRTVTELIDAGAAGCFLEDQMWPKKCGHMQGKRVIDRDDYIQKIRAAGADATFVEAPSSLDELKEIGRRAPKPTVANMIEQGKTPVLEQTQLAELGFDLILYPLAGLYASAHALTTVYDRLRDDGTTSGVRQQLMAFEQFNELIGVDEKRALAQRFGDSE